VVLLPDPAGPYAGRGDENFDYAGADESDRLLLEAVARAGFRVSARYVHLDNVDDVVDALACDAVLNLCDGSGRERDGMPGLEALDALERRGLPYTGSRASAYAIGSDKLAMKERFVAAGVPTPAWQLLSSPDAALAPELLAALPLIVKPRDGGGSAGIRLGSVVHTERELRERISEVCATYGAALVEQYVDGREITVGVIDTPRGPRVLPPLEVRFGASFPADRRIRTFDMKWDVSSPLYSDFELICPAPMTLALRRRVQHVARAAYAAIDGSGYARVDLRLDERGPFVLEVNPNCSLEWSDDDIGGCAMLPTAARAAGLDYPALLRELLGGAFRMRKKQREAQGMRQLVLPIPSMSSTPSSVSSARSASARAKSLAARASSRA
jgi:D-alanine-D-alanine ligase